MVEGDSLKLIGDILQSQGKITQAHIDMALKLQAQSGVPIGKILTHAGIITPLDLDLALAAQLELEFVSLLDLKLDLEIKSNTQARECIENLLLKLSDKDWIVADITESKKQELLRQLGPGGRLRLSSRFEVLYQLHLALKDQLTQQSVFALSTSYPAYSAARVIIGSQVFALYLLACMALIWLVLSPWSFLLTLNILVTLFLVVSFSFKLLLIWRGSHGDVDAGLPTSAIHELNWQELPVYSILVPMYKEAEVLPLIVRSLAQLNYPQEKLDIKLVLEEDDLETQARARALTFPANVEVIIVPTSHPKTKPKACNYALFFARGEYLTIYDAEDKPEPDQLLKALAQFRRSPPNTAVIQARLNYFNPRENWLARMFTLEYSLWFDFYLPALERLGVPIPLGGTSNHFKTKLLKLVGGWDPFNVTEDADLGIRFTQFGYRVGVVNSTTLEEANTHYGNWIRQRSRWIKGYIQTYLVHMRTPLKLWRLISHKAFFSFQFFIGGTFLTALITPLLYAVFFWWLLSKTSLFDPLFVEPLLYLSLLNLLLGNAFFIYVLMIGVFKRRYFDLIPWAISTPAYWLMLSIAAFKGLAQLITNPFYWEKTQHGLSRQTHEDLHES